MTGKEASRGMLLCSLVFFNAALAFPSWHSIVSEPYNDVVKEELLILTPDVNRLRMELLSGINVHGTLKNNSMKTNVEPQ